MAYVHPGSFNSYIPQATGQIIAYSRDPAKYRVNSYCQLVKTEKPVFVWYKLHIDDMGQRVTNTKEQAWVDGAKRPENHGKKVRFDLTEAQTIRRNEDFIIGWQAVQHSDLPLLVMHSNMARNLVMTARTKRVIDKLETATSAVWGSNFADANTLNGGKGHWDTASSDSGNPAKYLAIKRTLDAVREKILLATNSMIDYSEEAPKLLISPGLAQKMSQSDEIHSYLRESRYAMDQVTGKKAGQNAKWGLPDQIYGFDIEIEASSIVTERSQADGGEASLSGSPAPRRFIKSDDSAVVLSRVGGLDGRIGPSFSTVQIYYHEKELTLETKDESWDRRTLGSVVEEVVEVIAAPQSGFLITDVLSNV